MPRPEPVDKATQPSEIYLLKRRYLSAPRGDDLVDAGDAVVEEFRDPPLLLARCIWNPQIRVPLGIEIQNGAHDRFSPDLVLREL